MKTTWHIRCLSFNIKCEAESLLCYLLRHIVKIYSRTLQVGELVPPRRNVLLYSPNKVIVILSRHQSDREKLTEKSWGGKEGRQTESHMSAEFFQGPELLGTLS